MVSVNTIIIGGHLGAEPEERRTLAGKLVCNFRLATNRWDAKTESEVTDWHNVVVFERQAENCVKYLRKGAAVLIEGRLTSHHWDGPDGKKNTRWEIIANRVTFLGSSKAAEAQGEAGAGAPAYAVRETSGFSPDAVPF